MGKSLNKVMILGNACADAEVRETPNGTRVCSLSVATNSSYKDKSGEWKDKVSYHNVVLWGNLAEIAGKYVRKGDKVYIEGGMETKSWEDQNGVKKYKTEVVAREIILLGVKRERAQVGAPQAAEPIAGEDESLGEEIDMSQLKF